MSFSHQSTEKICNLFHKTFISLSMSLFRLIQREKETNKNWMFLGQTISRCLKFHWNSFFFYSEQNSNERKKNCVCASQIASVNFLIFNVMFDSYECNECETEHRTMWTYKFNRNEIVESMWNKHSNWYQCGGTCKNVLRDTQNGSTVMNLCIKGLAEHSLYCDHI